MTMRPDVTIVLPKTVMGKAKYVLVSDLHIGNYVVPSGFKSDGSTVPRLFWGLFPPVSSYFWAAVLECGVSKPVIFIKLFFVTIYGFIKKPKDYL